jgi:DNA polymerase III epsilon subunit-like protein
METGMKYFLTIATLCVALALTTACSSSTNTNTNTNTTTAKPAATAAAPAGTPAAADQGAAQDFTLVNKTGVEIDKMYISPHDKDDWEEDILGRDTLPSGETLDIKFHRNETAEMWDLRIEDKQGNAIEWENLNLLKISKVTIHYENGKATAEVE